MNFMKNSFILLIIIALQLKLATQLNLKLGKEILAGFSQKLIIITTNFHLKISPFQVCCRSKRESIVFNLKYQHFIKVLTIVYDILLIEFFLII